MFEEKAGELAGKVWEALNEGGELTGKALKKAIKVTCRERPVSCARLVAS